MKQVACICSLQIYEKMPSGRRSYFITHMYRCQPKSQFIKVITELCLEGTVIPVTAISHGMKQQLIYIYVINHDYPFIGIPSHFNQHMEGASFIMGWKYQIVKKFHSRYLCHIKYVNEIYTDKLRQVIY